MDPLLMLVFGASAAAALLALLWWRDRAGLRSRLEQAEAAALERAASLARLEGELAAARAAGERVPRLEEALEALRGELRQAEADRTRVRTELGERERAWAEKRTELESLHESLRAQFEALAGRLLEEKGERFSKQQTEGLTKLLVPFREQLDGFRKEFREASEKERHGQAQLEVHLKHLMELNQGLAQEATNLTRALTGQSKVRGNWGETITEQLLQKAGLLEGRHYRRQDSGTNEHGKRLQPDFVVELPDNRHVVIDSKVALLAYQRFCGEEDPDEQKHHLDAHCAALRQHVLDLAGKDYPSLYGFAACEATILCIPTDGALLDALRHQPELSAFAQERRVVLASPSLLQPILGVVSQMWRLDDQHRNAQAMAERVGKLCDKLAGGLEAFESVGTHLERAQKAFGDARGRLYDGQGNVLRQHELLRELGAPQKKELPRELEQLAALEAGEDEPVPDEPTDGADRTSN